MTESFPAIDATAVAQMSAALPFVRALGAEVVSVTPGVGKMKLAWREDLVGDPRSGLLHGGVITTLLDNASGMAVFSSLREVMQIATLDLRIDYLRPPVPKQDIHAEATCYRMTRTIAFVRGRAYQEPGGDIAASLATFILASSETRDASVRPSAP